MVVLCREGLDVADGKDGIQLAAPPLLELAQPALDAVKPAVDVSDTSDEQGTPP